MRPPEVVRYVEVLGERYLRGTSSVAALLGVTRRQADAWLSRRATNGFPGGVRVEVGGQTTWLFDPDEVLSWRASYQPSRGGAPTGERNGSWRDGSRRRLDDDGARVRAS